MSQAIVHRGAFAGERVRPHQCLRSRHRQNRMSTTLQAMQSIVRCVNCVKGRGRASPHVVVSEGELPEVGVDYAYLGPEGSK